MAKQHSIGYMLTQIALGLYFFVTGIWTLQGGNGNEIAAAVKSVTGGDTARIICLVFGIIEDEGHPLSQCAGAPGVRGQCDEALFPGWRRGRSGDYSDRKSVV